MKRCENCAAYPIDDDHICPSDDVRCIQLRGRIAELEADRSRMLREVQEALELRIRDYSQAGRETEARAVEQCRADVARLLSSPTGSGAT